jgi:hypothetical protein
LSTAAGFVGEVVTTVTVTEAVPFTPPCVAVTTPVVAVPPAVNVVLAPFVGANVPPLAVVVHVGEMPVTGFVYWSAAEAVRVWVPPVVTLNEDGETATCATGPAVMVSVWVTEFTYCPDAVIVGLPALVSW